MLIQLGATPLLPFAGLSGRLQYLHPLCNFSIMLRPLLFFALLSTPRFVEGVNLRSHISVDLPRHVASGPKHRVIFPIAN